MCYFVLAPWCGPCQQMVPFYKEIANQLQHDSGIEVGAVNCATQHELCGNRFGIRGYPTILAVNDKHGTRQEFHGNKSPEEVTKWARDLSKEWKWLFRRQDILTISSMEEFKLNVLDSTNFVIVAFLDGLDCSACMTAKTNVMRLSAALRGYNNITIALVDCEDGNLQDLCYLSQRLPARPHAPIIKGYQSGSKHASTIGETLYNSNDMEPHLAMEIMERLIRLAMSDRAPKSQVSDGTLNGFEKNKKDKEDEAEDEDYHERPPPQWNGPLSRHKINFGQGGSHMSRHALGH